MEHDGDPRYFYGKRSPAYATDPRYQNYDLGNDPIASLDAQIAHVKYLSLIHIFSILLEKKEGKNRTNNSC